MEHLLTLAAAANARAVISAAIPSFFRPLFAGKAQSSSRLASSSARSSSSGAVRQAGGFALAPNLLTIGIILLIAVVVLTGVLLLIHFLRKKRGKKKAGSDIPKTAELTEKSSNVLVGNAQDIGRRENQQDSFAVSDVGDEALCCAKGVFAVVADGMGGLANGAEVSRIAVGSMLSCFEQLHSSEQQENARAQPELLRRMLSLANDHVNEFLQKQGNVQSGSTVVAVTLYHKNLHWVAVGDSRIYLFRAGRLYLLNKPHNLGAQLDEQVLLGRLTREQALAEPERHALTSYLGIGRLELIDSNPLPLVLQRGDKVVLCSDGVFGSVSEQEMEPLLSLPPQQAAEEIEKQVALKGKKYQDNSTIVILESV